VLHIVYLGEAIAANKRTCVGRLTVDAKNRHLRGKGKRKLGLARGITRVPEKHSRQDIKE